MTDIATREKPNLEQQRVTINAASLANYDNGYDVDVQEWSADCMSIKASSEGAASSGKNTLAPSGIRRCRELAKDAVQITFGFYYCGMKEEVAKVGDRQHPRRNTDRKGTCVMGEEREIMYKERDCKKISVGSSVYMMGRVVPRAKWDRWEGTTQYECEKKKCGSEINSDGSKGNGGLSDMSKQYGIIEKGIIMKKAMRRPGGHITTNHA
ncbi:hypothetical protein C8J57DRAFT_1253148 [Mycena rebaudengoi]|nr:hypothetical protein C8J57DRAFT_1253148 [Mycena rebaudengoi]